MEKLTKLEKFIALEKHLNGEKVAIELAELQGLIANEISKLEKAKTNVKATKNQVVNEGLKEVLLANMTVKALSISEIVTNVVSENSELATVLTNQKVSALLKQLITEGLVMRTEKKRKAYFSKVEGV